MTFAVVLLGLLAGLHGRAPAEPPPVPTAAAIEFEQQVLDNGLRVIYAPLRNAPVVHVRVLYHVGSRDERPDRQGFAHLFEHMMFRGSEHVEPEQHMKLVGDVGGMSNAFTSFDQTVYVNTVPASHLEMALWLEADRMASFRVSESIYETERKVVAEEYRMRRNRPYGDIFDKVFGNVFTTHSYRWTPIGNMEHLAQAGVGELQSFYNEYYAPNNAVLVIAGDFDVAQAREQVERFFGWIPSRGPVQRNIPKEPGQAEPRRAEVVDRVPLPAVIVAFQRPSFGHPDTYAVDLLAAILGGGGSTRLSRELVNNPDPVAMQAFAINEDLQDGGLFGLAAIVLAGKDPAAAEQGINRILEQIRSEGVSQDELELVRRQALVSTIRGRDTASELADQLGSEALLGGDPSRANRRLESLAAVTVEDIKRVANDYFTAAQATTVNVLPGPAASPATQPTADRPADAPAEAPSAPEAKFPADYPTEPPAAAVSGGRAFEKGQESSVEGVRVITLADHRLPIVNMNLVLRGGGHHDPADKVGLSAITADLVSRGAGESYIQWATELESRGISLGVSDQGDVIRVSGSALSTELDELVSRAAVMLRRPTLDPDEFARLKAQTLSGLKVRMEQPDAVALDELLHMLYGDSVLGRKATPGTVEPVTLDDVKATYQRQYQPKDALLVFSGDITPDRAEALAGRLLDGWSAGEPLARPEYEVATPGSARQIVIVDHPTAKQATVMLGVPAYTIRSEDKFAGAIANRILTGGIDSRLMKYVRAEKGLAYGASGVFAPNRHGGHFMGKVDTAIPTARAALDAMEKVLVGMRDETVGEEELTGAKTEVAGGMLMQLQTIGQQAGFRIDGILNDYPIDYYDRYPERVGQVSADQVRQVMRQYVDPAAMNVVVIGPADQLTEQFKDAGEVKVVPMPAQRVAPDGEAPATAPSP